MVFRAKLLEGTGIGPRDAPSHVTVLVKMATRRRVWDIVSSVFMIFLVLIQFSKTGEYLGGNPCNSGSHVTSFEGKIQLRRSRRVHALEVDLLDVGISLGRQA